jgi:hypothetical protein
MIVTQLFSFRGRDVFNHTAIIENYDISNQIQAVSRDGEEKSLKY